MIVPLFIGLLVLTTLRSVAADDTGTPEASSIEATIAVPSPTVTVAAPTPVPTEEATATPATPEPTPTMPAPEDQVPPADSTPAAPFSSPTSAAPDSETDSVATPSETATADVATPVREEPDAEAQLRVTARTESIAALPGASFTLWYDISNPGTERVEALVSVTNSHPDWSATLFASDGVTPLSGPIAIPAADTVTVRVSIRVPFDARVDDHNLTTVDAIVPPDDHRAAE